jgi:uncharacterized lipoprotein YmbA
LVEPQVVVVEDVQVPDPLQTGVTVEDKSDEHETRPQVFSAPGE